MSREQRWAASGVVVLLGALWGGLGVAGVTAPYRQPGPPDDSMGLVWVWLLAWIVLAVDGVWLVVGLVAVRRVASGTWRWWPPAVIGVLISAFSLVAAVSAAPEGPDWWVLLLGFQSLALLAWAILLWTPAAGSATGEDAA